MGAKWTTDEERVLFALFNAANPGLEKPIDRRTASVVAGKIVGIERRGCHGFKDKDVRRGYEILKTMVSEAHEFIRERELAYDHGIKTVRMTKEEFESYQQFKAKEAN